MREDALAPLLLRSECDREKVTTKNIAYRRRRVRPGATASNWCGRLRDYDRARHGRVSSTWHVD